MPRPKNEKRAFYDERVNAIEAASFLGISERSFYRLVEERVIPKEADGVYILGEVVDAYYKNLLGNKGLAAARTRLANAEAEIRELELAEMKRQMFRASDVSRAWTDNVINVRARLLAIPAKISHELLGQDLAEIHRILQLEIYEVLNELAEYSGETIAAASEK